MTVARFGSALFALCFILCASADEWFADASKPAGSGDGMSATTAFHTIQEAVDKASAGDTVWVAPGTYDEGTTVGLGKGTADAQLSRVVIDKRINLFSSGSRDDTFILGSYAGLAKPHESADAVQCICITKAGAGSVIRGFTLRDGVLRSCYADIGGGGVVYSSGVTAITPADNFYVVLCHIDHCVGRVGGAMAGGGWAIATLFTRNWSCGDSASQKGSAIYKTNLYNCIFADNGEDPNCNRNAYAVSNPGVAVNCTAVNNFRQFGIQQNSPTETSGRFYNVAAVQNVNVSSDASLWIDSCVIEGSYGSAKSTDVTVCSTTKSGWSQLMMAPILGDYRPVAGGYMDGKGNREYLALVPEAYRNMDFNGNDWDSTTASVPVGAILPAATPVATPVYVQSAFTVGGRQFARSNGRMYLFADACPKSVYFQTNAAMTTFHSFSVVQYGTASTGTMRHFADPKGGYWLTLSEEYVGGVKQAESTIEAADYDAGYVYYVDEKNGSDSNAGTSADAAFATLAKASSMMTSEGKNCIVYVAPGVYSNGVCTGGYSGHAVRFRIPEKCHLWLVGTGGKDVTVIEGAADLGAPESDLGCGDNAVGGVDCYGNCNAGICGFTFRNCRTYKVSTGNSGAAVCANGSNAHVFDCDFHDNVAAGSGGAISRAHVVRCRFWNNVSIANFGTAYGSVYCGCLFWNCPDSKAVVSLGRLYNCTICSEGISDATGLIADGVDVYNTLVFGGGKLSATTGKVVGNVCWDLASVGWSNGYVVDDPKVAATWRNDFRPFAGTAACTAGGFSADIQEFGRFTTTDVNGNPLFPTGGEKTVGAVATVRTTNRAHYVNAVTGNDANDGLTESTAKKTLTAAMDADDLCAGETVFAAEGTYDTGFSYESGVDADNPGTAVPSRVVVRPSVTLKAVSDDPSKTELRGADGVRCAFVEGGGVLSGFTLCGATLTSEDARAELRCAGVLGRGYNRSTTENCVICDLYANHCPAASKICLRGCRILRASAVKNSDRAIVEGCSMYSCLLDHCRGNPMIENYHDVVNVTVGRDNYNYGNNSKTHMIQPPADANARIVNSLFLQNAAVIAQNVGLVSNSVFAKPIVLSDKATLVNVTKDVDYDTLAAQLDANLTPKSRDNDLLVNVGINDPSVGDRDAFGKQRVQNGTIDIGASEFDYFPIYLADMGNPRNVTLKGTSDGVVDDNGSLKVPAGESIDLVWDAGKHLDAGYIVKATVSGDGVLAVYANGVRVGEIDASGSLTFETGLPSSAIRLAYEPSTADGFATVDLFHRGIGMLMIVR